MQAPIQPPVYSLKSGVSGRPVFLQPGQYHTCHIRVPDMARRLPAIVVNGQFYSFFKGVKDRQKAQDILAKLFAAGEEVIITANTKTHSIWILEPNAYVDRPRQS